MANFEAGIADYLKEAAAERSPDLWEKQATYGRQYIGIERDGKQLLYASFFCDIRTENDLKRLMVGQMIGADGGDCLFQRDHSTAGGYPGTGSSSDRIGSGS